MPKCYQINMFLSYLLVYFIIYIVIISYVLLGSFILCCVILIYSIFSFLRSIYYAYFTLTL